MSGVKTCHVCSQILINGIDVIKRIRKKCFIVLVKTKKRRKQTAERQKENKDGESEPSR